MATAFRIGQEGTLSPYSVMELKLSRNAAAISESMTLLADADRMIDECSACLLREVIVSEAQAVDHNRSIEEARSNC